MAKTTKDTPGMQGIRARTKKGKLRGKRNDTKAKTLEEKYNVNFNVNGNMKLKTLLQKKKVASLSQLLHKTQKR